MGVFATRSPFRPNPIGLSCVEIAGIDYECENAPVIKVLSADLMNGTPILDIKPYLPQFDSKPEAAGGFSKDLAVNRFEVIIPEKLRLIYPDSFLSDVTAILSNDPRPQYHNDPERIYGGLLMLWAGLCRFIFCGRTAPAGAGFPRFPPPARGGRPPPGAPGPDRCR